MAKMTKNEQNLRKYYFSQMQDVIKKFGGRVLREPSEEDPSGEYDLLTNAGRLYIHLTDDTAFTCFDRPKLGNKIAYHANQYSGKWNFHTFISQQKPPTKEIIDGYIQHFVMSLEDVNARVITYSPAQSITPQDVVRIGFETLFDRIAMGEDFIVEGFDQEAFAKQYASEVTDNEGMRPAWLVNTAEASIMRKTVIEAYKVSLSWNAQNVKETPNLPTARMSA
jgi:hypothetical protein